MRKFLQGVIGGAAISLGGIIYLSMENKVIGAFLFSIGLFSILVFQYGLITGKFCSMSLKDLLQEWQVWVGNLVGTVATGIIVQFTRNGQALSQKAAEICSTKISDNALSLFILAILCNICIFVAVYGFKTAGSPVIGLMAVIFGVMVFILSGFEHCVADMFYLSLGNAWLQGWWIIPIITAGNLVGGQLGYLTVADK